MRNASEEIVSRETLRCLATYETELKRWNARINLVGPNELRDFWTRHVLEGVHLGALIPRAGRLVDLGSGAGFPGLIVAVTTGRPVTLIEADKRKAAFLRETARTLGASVSVIADRIERSGLTDADIIISRGLAPLGKLLALAKPLMTPTGMCLFIKGARVEIELTEARRQWQMECRHHPNTTGGCVIEVTHLHRSQTARHL